MVRKNVLIAGSVDCVRSGGPVCLGEEDRRCFLFGFRMIGRQMFRCYEISVPVWFLSVSLSLWPLVDAAAVEVSAVASEGEKTGGSAGAVSTADEAELYVRVVASDGKPRAMQTAIARFRGPEGSPYQGCQVDLVGVVHIGEEDYYRILNERLSRYESVLYELVAPDGTRIRPEDLDQRRSVLASMQTGMKDMLNLEYQLEKIDYLAKNFRHADMSPDEFIVDMERRGDSVAKMVARMMGAGLASSASTGGDATMLFAFFSKDRAKLLKQSMAKQLVDVETVTAGFNDANGENTLIKGRNAKAFQVLRDELKQGKKKIAVFYGAGHLADMAERLKDDFQMESDSMEWLDAWDLTSN